MAKKFCVFLSFIFLSLFIKAGEVDTAYIQKFKNIFAAKTFLMNNGFFYNLTPRGNSTFTEQQLNDAKLFYSPHIPTTVGVSLNIKGIGFTYVFKFTNDYLDTTGRIKSGYKGFQMNIYGDKFGFEGYYQDYQRFYFHYKGDEILLKNYNTDIRSYKVGANAILIFNGGKFSYNAAFNQTQLQKKSAGSAMMLFSLRFDELKSGHLIPDSVKLFYGDIANLHRNRNIAFFLQGGYAFNITKNNFYFSNAYIVGAGIQSQIYNYTEGNHYRIGLPLIGRAKASMGYNGKVFFGGVFANADVTQSRIKTLKTQQFQYSYGVYIGFRAIQFTKNKSQLKKEAKEKKMAEDAAKKKTADAKKQAAKDKKKKK
ncbi:hypothetical protein BH10BAC1_BH10BAC1_19170 [soil metagenome]